MGPQYDWSPNFLFSYLMTAGISACLVLAGGSYVLTSVFFLKNPLKRQKKRHPVAPALLIAHRGGAGEGYENTLNTFWRAVNCGANMLELDVHLTKDDEVVVAHDSNLERITGRNISVSDCNYGSLPLLKEDITIDFCPGSTFSDKGAPEGHRKFAKLDEVLESFPNTQINIDLKSKSRELAERVNSLIMKHGAERRCVWGNFSQETTDFCHSLNPEVGLLFSMPRVIRLYLAFYTGVLPFMSLPETHLEIPMPSIFLSPKYRTPEGNVGMARMAPVLLKVADWFLMSPVLFNHLKRRGIHVYLWVLNSEEEYRKALDVGATGIMTDFPSKLSKFLEK